MDRQRLVRSNAHVRSTSLGSRVSLDFFAVPIELDRRTETILRKAYVLADDWKIDSPDLIKQLMPK